MYRIIGGDGKEYGPISTDQMRQWIAQNRVNGATLVRPESGGDWKALSTYPEFTVILPRPAGVMPAHGVSANTGGESGTSGLAIASLVLGILGIFTCGVGALVAIVLGIVALVQINKSQERLKGRGLAIAGICVAAVSLLVLPAMLLPALGKAKQKAMTINCINNMKQVGIAMRTYASVNNDKLPPAATWSTDISSYVGNTRVFHCVGDSRGGMVYSYAFNQRLSGKTLSEINPGTVLLFESDGGPNNFGGMERLSQARHGQNQCNVLFADGSVRVVRDAELMSLRWDP
jgi:prepilin-type processing-associated H-X9-DG protein